MKHYNQDDEVDKSLCFYSNLKDISLRSYLALTKNMFETSLLNNDESVNIPRYRYELLNFYGTIYKEKDGDIPLKMKTLIEIFYFINFINHLIPF